MTDCIIIKTRKARKSSLLEIPHAVLWLQLSHTMRKLRKKFSQKNKSNKERRRRQWRENFILVQLLGWTTCYCRLIFFFSLLHAAQFHIYSVWSQVREKICVILQGKCGAAEGANDGSRQPSKNIYNEIMSCAFIYTNFLLQPFAAPQAEKFHHFSSLEKYTPLMSQQ